MTRRTSKLRGDVHDLTVMEPDQIRIAPYELMNNREYMDEQGSGCNRMERPPLLVKIQWKLFPM